MRVRIMYRVQDSNKLHQPTYEVQNALELFDRLMRIRGEKLEYFRIDLMTKYSTRWSYSCVIWPTFDNIYSYPAVDYSRWSDPEYREELAVKFFEEVEKRPAIQNLLTMHDIQTQKEKSSGKWDRLKDARKKRKPKAKSD